MRFIMFTKHLQTMSVEEAGRTIKKLGFDGVELTVRPNGHILPENAREELPRAVEKLKEIGLDTPALVVEIQNRQQEYSAVVCEMAAKVGARELRTSSARYRGFGNIREQLASAKKDAKDLESLGREYGVRLDVHAHSGDFLSCQGALLDMWIGETDPRYVGVSLDLGHWTAEGMKSGWKASIDLMQGRVGLVAIKSYGWFYEPDPKTGQKRWVGKLVPLDEGSVQFKQAFEYLRQGSWDADGTSLVSVHSEYQGAGSWRSLEVPELVEQTRKDFDYLREQVGVLQPA